ncbi:MAG: rhodanese-like domain-containing protein [Abyssibacter sp.]|uniref:rhodanese-like domain-containing protein n=1 Tax=Abyssibacter sp. TaxID=2320200 RepID=UPI003219001D
MTQPAYSARELVRHAKGLAGTLSAEEVAKLHHEGAILIDVREPTETASGRIRGAHALPRGTLEFSIGDVTDDHDARIVTYCSAGSRAALAAATLKQMGYAGAIASEAGFDDLRKTGLPIEYDNEE